MSQALQARALQTWTQAPLQKYHREAVGQCGPTSSFLGSCGQVFPEDVRRQSLQRQRGGFLKVRASNRNPPKKPPPDGDIVRGLAQREKYLKPFMLDIFFSNRNCSAKIMNRVNSHVVAGVATNEKRLKMSLICMHDVVAAQKVGELLAERALRAEVYSVTFELRKQEKWDEKYEAIMSALVERGIKIV
ncbi:Ribosomal L18p/L5e family protein [Klebsormidium nitens]|uniref:Ribosomal L18p/L5e family protein n=1 Tax=Klebsormidium nitens TaxID=105231 RepID=A0A1Y1I8U9_KLENI|nr:Ribosomal L18p/L5e family protein [Klebsormidium nitens]|eukprot:GAQ86963.1 Ribosomal L18p/L5e family protein [Klebsormidium nitens]